MMRKTFNYSLLGLGLFLFFACNSAEKQSEIPVIDVTKTYPEKKIVLQDIADVEYIPLETRDGVLVDQAKKLIFVSKDTIIVCNNVKGDVIFFNGKGKFLHSFNHKGQSGEEYLSMIEVIFSRTKKELYVYDILGGKKRILVYSEKGKYKRSLSITADNLGALVDYDNEYLLAFEGLEFGKENIDKINTTPFFFVDKKTGEIDTLKEFNIVGRKNTALYQNKGKFQIIFVSPSSYITPLQLSHSFVLDELTKDTIFRYTKDKLLEPICLKSPRFKEQGSDKVLALLENISKKWIFISLQINSLNASEYTIDDIRNGKVHMLEPTKLLVNRQTGEIFTRELKNKNILSDDFSISVTDKLFNAEALSDLLEEEKLSGKLKEIAEKLSPDDNPVLVKVRFKE